jgi:hypothetical protein
MHHQLRLERRKDHHKGFCGFVFLFLWNERKYSSWRRFGSQMDLNSFLAFKTTVIYYEAKYIVGCFASNV